VCTIHGVSQSLFDIVPLEGSLKVLVGILVSLAGVAPAFAGNGGWALNHPSPAPAPDLAVGAPAVLAVIVAYAVARLVIRHRAAPKAIAS
jgi:hypothetical protein